MIQPSHLPPPPKMQPAHRAHPGVPAVSEQGKGR